MTKVEEISSLVTHWRSNPSLAENFGNFLPSTSLWRWAVRFDEEIHNFYEISVALTYMGEMSTPTTHWR